jgi:hypothetical protein
MTDAVLNRLISGREKIENRWTKGTLKREEGYCAGGAVLADDGTLDPIAAQAVQLLNRQVPKGYHPGPGFVGEVTVSLFNDEYQTTQGAILDLYDRAIRARRIEVMGIAPDSDAVARVHPAPAAVH